MAKFVYVLIAILSALVTVWCSFNWTLYIAVFLAFSLLLLLKKKVGVIRVRQKESDWSDNNDSTVKKIHKGNNSRVEKEDNNSYKGHSYLKRGNSVNRSKKQNLGSESDSEDEEIPSSVRSTNTRRTTTLLSSIMSDLEKSISKGRLKSLFSVFNRGSGVENDRPVSSAGRYNNKEERRKNGRQANRCSGMAVGGDGRTPHMSPLMTPSAGCRMISRSGTPRIMASPRSRISTGYDSGRATVRQAGANNCSPLHQRQKGRFAKRGPVSPTPSSSSSPLSTSLLPRFHRTICESPDRPGINPVGFTLHALQRPEVCYPSNSSPGMLPHVRLEKRIKIPLVESNPNKMRSPVTVRIAPPETGVIHSPKFTSLKQDLDFSVTPDTSDVLLALREGTRKRTNAIGSDEDSMFESGNNTAKRRRQESNHSTASSSSLPSLPDFLPDLSLCNFTPSSYMSPNSRYMVPSSSSSIVNSSSGSVMNSASGLVVSSDGINSGMKRPVAPNAHLSHADNTPNSKRQRQETINNPILSSLSSSQRYRLHKKESVKRKAPDSPELQDPTISKENQDTHSIDNQQTEKQASKTCKLSQSLTENTTRDTDINQTSVSTTTPDPQSEETEASTSGSESKTPDLKSRRKHLSFASPSINLNRLSYANVYATKQDYENDRKAEQERVEKMLNRIATEKKTPDEDLLSEKNVVGSPEESSQITTVLTVPSPGISSSTKALTCTTAANSVIVSSTTASLASSSSSSLLAPNTTTTAASTPSSATTATSSIFSSTSTTAAAAATRVLPSASSLSSLLQTTSTLVTPSSTTSSTTIPQVTTTTTTIAGLLSSSTKPTETSISSPTISTITSSSPPFQPMFGGPVTTSTQSPSVGGLQFEVKTSSPLSSAIPSTTSSLSPSVTTSSLKLGTFSMASATSPSPAPTSAPTTTATSDFALNSAKPPSSVFTPSTTAPTTNAGSTFFSSPSKDAPKSGGFSFTLLSPQSTPTSFAPQKLSSPSTSSLFSVPKTQIPSTSPSSLFPFPASSAPTFTTATTTSTALTFGGAAVPVTATATSTTSTPAPSGFAFGQTTTSASLSQSSTAASSPVPTSGIFTFKPSNTATSTTSSTPTPTSNPTGNFTFKGSTGNTSVTTQPSSEPNPIFGASGSKTGLTAFASSGKPTPVFGASTFSAASTKFGASLTTSTPTFGATSTSAPTFEATSSAPKASFGVATAPTFGMTSTTSTPVFGSSSTPTSTSAFASPTSTTSTLFGSANQPKAAFGATSSPFGAASTTSTAFGGASTAFGSPSSTTNLFGASTNQSTQANTNSTGSFAFNSSSNTAQQTSSTTAPIKGFNFSFGSATASPNTFNFGGNNAASTTTGTTTTATSTVAAGSTSIFGGQASSTFGQFSSVGQDGLKSVFGSTSSNTPGLNFNRTPTQQTSNMFGQTGQTAQSSLFSSSEQQQTNQPFTFGQGSTPGNATTPFGQASTPGTAATPFGQASTPGSTNTPFGQASTPGTATTPFGQATTPGNAITPFGQSPAFSSPQASSFGSFGAKPNMFASPTNNNDKPSQAAPNIFGSTPASVPTARVAAQPKPLFGQSSSQPFGATSSSPSNTGGAGLFRATATGQASTPAAAAAAAGSTAPGIFTFGQSSATPQPANPSQGFDFSASLTGPSQFNFGQAGTASKPPMFNMGSGSTAPKMRSTHTKARRRGAKK